MAKVANPSQVYSSLKSNIDAVVGFSKPYTLNGVTLNPADIATREVQVAIPSSTTATQWAQIGKAIQYGQSLGVTVKITVVKP